MASSRPRLKIEETRVTNDRPSEYKPKIPAPQPRWIIKLLMYLRMVPPVLPKPTIAAPLAAPEISDCMAGCPCPRSFATSFNTIIGMVSSLLKWRSSILPCVQVRMANSLLNPILPGTGPAIRGECMACPLAGKGAVSTISYLYGRVILGNRGGVWLLTDTADREEVRSPVKSDGVLPPFCASILLCGVTPLPIR